MPFHDFQVASLESRPVEREVELILEVVRVLALQEGQGSHAAHVNARLADRRIQDVRDRQRVIQVLVG